RLDDGQDPDRSAVADAMAVAEVGDPIPQRLRLLTSAVGATAVEPLVARHELRPLAAERRQEVLARAGPEVQKARPDGCRAGVARGLDDVREQLRPIRQPGQD